MQKDLKRASTPAAVARPAMLGRSVTVRAFLRPGTYGKKLRYRTSERSGLNYGWRAAAAGLFLCSARDGQAGPIV